MSDNSQRVLGSTLFLLLCCSAYTPVLHAQSKTQDWPVWRGPNRNGVANQDQEFVTDWSESKNILWKAKVPGRGHASPIIVGDKIFLATAYDSQERQTVLCYSRKDGKKLWETEINKGNFAEKIFLPNNTHASPTISSDNKSIFVVFNNNESAQLAALDMDGKILWRKKAGIFRPKYYKFGYGASPLVYNGMVIVSSECEQEGTMKAFDVKDGKEIWSAARDKATSYSSPVVAKFGDKEILLMCGGKEVCAYNPKNGKKLWSTETIWSVSCGTPVWDAKRGIVFVSGGYPRNQTLAVSAKDGKVLWTNRVKCYEQSMVVHNGYLYGMDDRGITYCWDGKDGTEKWKHRLKGPVSSSPILAGGNIYIANQRGTHYVFKATPEKFESVAENQLGESHFATPAFCDNKIYARVATGSNRNRKEYLYCIGKKSE